MKPTLWLAAGLCLGLSATPESQGRGNSGIRFQEMDVNGDTALTQEEWRAAFDRLDTNRDGRLSRQEFDNPPAIGQPQTAAYRTGYDRGVQEGIPAGREDKAGPKVWDLEGQRELEAADSGYEARMGNRAEYQAGYRAGFRRGYREGFGPR